MIVIIAPQYKSNFEPSQVELEDGWRDDMLLLTALYERLHRWWNDRRTVRELSLLTDRDLTDLGLDRHQINRVARNVSGF